MVVRDLGSGLGRGGSGDGSGSGGASGGGRRSNGEHTAGATSRGCCCCGCTSLLLLRVLLLPCSVLLLLLVVGGVLLLLLLLVVVSCVGGVVAGRALHGGRGGGGGCRALRGRQRWRLRVVGSRAWGQRRGVVVAGQGGRSGGRPRLRGGVIRCVRWIVVAASAWVLLLAIGGSVASLSGALLRVGLRLRLISP